MFRTEARHVFQMERP